jgi:predicted aldo/keto reductase-like oxidoreductase
MEAEVLRPGQNAYASNCVKCGKCEKHCPQHIQIIKELEKAKRILEPWYVKFAAKMAKKLIGKERNA